jgi:hypothetical protein
MQAMSVRSHLTMPTQCSVAVTANCTRAAEALTFRKGGKDVEDVEHTKIAKSKQPHASHQICLRIVQQRGCATRSLARSMCFWKKKRENTFKQANLRRFRLVEMSKMKKRTE